MRQFTTVARPYLLSDLRKIASDVLQAFHDQLALDASATKLMEDLRSATTAEALTPDVRHKVRQLAHGLRSDGRTAAAIGEGLLARLSRSVDALAEWPEQTGGTALWNQSKHLEAIASDPAYKVKIRHPKPESYSVEIRIDPSPDVRGLCWIASESYWQSFRANPPEKNILYLSSEYREYDFVEFNYQNRYRAYYKRLAYSDPRLGLPSESGSRSAGSLGVFFQEVVAQAFAAKGNAPTANLHLAPMDDAAAYAEYPTIGWLNPLILTFDLDDDDIPVDVTQSRADQALRLFSHPDLLLHFEPHLDPLERARLEFLERLANRQGEQRESLSMVEFLLWGGREVDALRSFVVLDNLSGSFAIDGFGRYRTDGRLPVCHWIPPDGLSRNEIWLKTYLLGRSDHIREAPKSIDMTLVSSEMPGFGSPRGHARVQLHDPATETPILDVLATVTRTPATADDGMSTVRLHEHVLALAEEQLEALAPAKFVEQLYFGEGSIDLQSDGTAIFDDLGFLEAFGRAYLSPRSRVYVRLPQIEHDDAWADLTRSVPYGDKALFENLVAAQIGSFVPAERAEVAYEYGWWQDWFELLFVRPWDVSIDFISMRGFIVRRSLLGRAPLGKASIGKQFDVSAMRI